MHVTNCSYIEQTQSKHALKIRDKILQHQLVMDQNPAKLCFGSNSKLNDRLTARLHVGEKRGFNLHVGVVLRPLVLALNGA